MHHAGLSSSRSAAATRTGAAYDGYNVNGSDAVDPADGRAATKFSPKALARLERRRRVDVHGGRSARRIASPPRRSCISSCPPARRSRRRIRTSSPTTCSRPSCASSASSSAARVQLSLFQDDVHDAIISQFQPLVANSTHAVLVRLERRSRARARRRARARHERHPGRGARVLREASRTSMPKTLAMIGPRERDGARPMRRSASSCRTFRSGARTFTATYRPDERFAVQPRRPLQLQALHDARQRRRALQHVPGLLGVVRDGHARELPGRTSTGTASLGVDNVLDRKYFLFHPFPQRTFIAGLKYGFQ